VRPGLDLLRSVPFFSSCSEAELSALDGIGDLARVGPDDVLYSEGDTVAEINVLTAGYAGATRLNPNGSVVLADVILPVRPLSLPVALLGKPAPAGMRMLTAGRLIVFDVESLWAMLDRHPGLERRLFELALKELRDLEVAAYDLKLQSAPRRLAKYLLTLAREHEATPVRFVLPFEKRLLAAQIGCSQENLSRAFAALRPLGVETQRGIIVLRDILRLYSFVGIERP